MARKTGSAAVNFSAKVIQDMLAQHGCSSPLCTTCKFHEKRVPAAFKALPPGTPYPCKSKLLGADVVLRGETEPSTIVGCATPLGSSLLQEGRRSERYACQGAYVVRTPLGIETAVAKSVVRERRREREGNCPDMPDFTPGVAAQAAREAKRQNVHPHQLVDDLPFPHRKGSTPCCVNSKDTPDALDAAFREAWDGTEAEHERLIARVRKALPKALRAQVQVAEIDDVPRAIRALRDHCWAILLTKEERAAEGKKGYQTRVTEAKKARRKAGWNV